MKYIIMAGGNYPRWETPRHLTKIHGETLVGRTIRLLRENGIRDISISTQDERFRVFDVPILSHENNYIWGADEIAAKSYWVDAFYPTEEPACYLMGDVFFSPWAIASIVNYQQGEDIMFSSNETPAEEYVYAKKLGALINFDDITHIATAADIRNHGRSLSLLKFGIRSDSEIAFSRRNSCRTAEHSKGNLSLGNCGR